MKETSLTKIQYFRKKTKEEIEYGSKNPSQKNDDNSVKQKETKVHFCSLGKGQTNSE
jgi:hypothetical protein